MKLGLDFTVDIKNTAIQNDIKLFYDTFSKTITIQASHKIEKFALTEMNGYYNEYDPDYYERTYQMYDWSYKRYAVKGSKFREGGIFIKPEFTEHDPRGKNFSEEDIYINVWDKGIHGVEYRYGKNYEPIQGEPDRFGKIERIVASNQFQEEMFNNGISAAVKKKYSVLRFS